MFKTTLFASVHDKFRLNILGALLLNLVLV